MNFTVIEGFKIKEEDLNQKTKVIYSIILMDFDEKKEKQAQVRRIGCP